MPLFEPSPCPPGFLTSAVKSSTRFPTRKKAKKFMMQSSTVISLQKRLAPVYEALDNEKYTLAIKICDKAIGKGSKDIHALKALKALALVRSGAYQPGYDLAHEVKLTRPSDLPTLQACFLTFKMLHLYDEIVDLYSHAYNALPEDEELANHYFMAVARKGDWKTLQMAAVKIQKTFKSNQKYYFWMVMAIYLQAIDPANTKSKNLLLQLGLKMMEKAYTESKIDDYESLQLYQMILESLGKYQESLDLLDGSLAELCKVDLDRKKICIDLMTKIGGKSQDIVDICKSALIDNPDDWVLHTKLMESSLEIERTKSEKYLKFLKSLQSTEGEKKKPARGPFLAELYYLKELSLDYTDNIENYLRKFGNLLCCYDDLFPVLDSVTKDQHEKLSTNVSKYLIKDQTPTVSQTRININTYKILRYFNQKFDKIDIKAEIATLLPLYTASCKALKDERERQYGDDYLLLIAHALLEVYANEKDQKLLFSAISILEHGLAKSKFNYNFKIILTRLYAELGITDRTLDIAVSLDIKNIQFDTLSFIFTDGLELFGQYSYPSRLLQNSLSIYDRNEIETPEMIIQAFRYGTFSKIPEFIDFKSQLVQSVQKAVTHRQVNRLELLGANNWNQFLNRVSRIDISALSSDGSCPFLSISSLTLDKPRLYDNRDVSLTVRFSPHPGSILSVIRGKPFPIDVVNPENYWLKLQSFISLLYTQLLSNNVPKFVVKVEDVEEFLQSSSLNESESLCLRILLLFLKHKNETDVRSDMDLCVNELDGLWKGLEGNLELIGKGTVKPSFSFCEKLTLTLEAANAAIAFTCTTKDKNLKTGISRQLRDAKKAITKVQALLLSESVHSLKQKFFDEPFSSLPSAAKTVEFLQRGWDNTLQGFLKMIDGRLAMLQEVK